MSFHTFKSNQFQIERIFFFTLEMMPICPVNQIVNDCYGDLVYPQKLVPKQPLEGGLVLLNCILSVCD